MKCRESSPEKVIRKKAAKIKLWPDRVQKSYLAKYYDQRLAYRSVGEPYILDRHRHPLFAHSIDCVYNPHLTVEFIEHQPKLHSTYYEHVVIERFRLSAAQLTRSRSCPIVSSLLKWIEGYLSVEGKLPVVHRDIQPAHIMLGDDGWKLIDFAIAVPKEDWTAECEIGPRWDDVATLEAIYREFDREGK